MSNEIRGAGNLTVPSGKLGFELPPGGAPNRFWYWRDGSVIYRGQGVDLVAAGTAAQELANLIINNPDGNSIFSLDSSGLLRIELSAGKNNYNYTLINQVRPRN